MFRRCEIHAYGHGKRNEICHFDAKIEILENFGVLLAGTVLVKDVAFEACCLCNHVPQTSAEEYFILPWHYSARISASLSWPG